jgi:hypothetical protein
MAFSLALLGASTYEVPVALGSYDLLATEILTSSQASVTFASLGTYAADYQHLQIRGVSRTSFGYPSDNIRIRINGQTATYAFHILQVYGDNSLNAGAGANSNGSLIAPTTGGTATSNVFGAQVIDLLDPFVSNKNRTFRGFGGHAQGSTNNNNVGLQSGARFSTDSITAIELSPWAGANLVTGSRFSLYGIRKAA